MKILIYTNNFLPIIGGAEIMIHNLAEGLVALGHDVIVATFQRRKINPISNYRLVRLSNIRGATRLGIGDTTRRFMLYRFIKKISPDIIHVHFSIPSGYDIAKLNEKLKIPIILTCHGEDIQKVPSIPYGYRLDPKKEKIIKYSINSFNALIAISNDVKKEYLSLNVPIDRIEMCPNPINFKELQNKNTKLKKHLNIDENKKIILAVGRNHPKKGFDSLIAIINILVNRFKIKDVLCLIIGGNVTKLQKIINKKNLSSYFMLKETIRPVGIQFIGEKYNTEDLLENYFQIADIYAMSSSVESFGLVTLEAMAAGLVVIGFDSPGTNELIESNFNGFIVEKNDTFQFAETIKNVLTNISLFKELIKNAKNTAKQFSRLHIANKHLGLYQKIIKQNKKNDKK